MKLESYHWKQNQPLAEAFVQQFGQIQDLFEYNPWSDKVWEERLSWLDSQTVRGANRARLAAVLEQYNKRIHNAPEAFESISALNDKETLAVVGGQQAGLFTGPLYVIHKAITIIQAAKQASDKLQRKVVPIFWIAGEDHDFDEVNHMNYLSQDLQLQKIKIDHPTGKRSTVSRVQIPLESWEEAIREIDGSLMNTEFKPALLEKLQTIGKQSDTLVDFFGHIMAWLFGSYGLILMDSDDPELRRLESGMFEMIISKQDAIREALWNGKSNVEALGFRSQLELQPDCANLFLTHNEERALLFARGDEFSDKKSELKLSKQQLLEIAADFPERLSNNVATRPMMQDFLFPVLATVLGPGEIAYWSLLREVFHAVEMKMPIVLPRLEFTLMEGTLQKHMQKYDLSFDDVVHRFDDKKKKWLEAQDTMKLGDVFEDVKRRFGEMYSPVIERVGQINPGMRKLGETNLQKIVEQIDFLASRSQDAYESQFDSSLRQLDRIRLSIAPSGRPQERVYNIFAYLNKYGDGWLRELIETPIDVNGRHRIVYF